MFHQKIIYLFLIFTFTCLGSKLEISFKFGTGIGGVLELGEHENSSRRRDITYLPSGGLLMLNTGFEFKPISFFSFRPEARLLTKLTGELNYYTTTSLFGGGRVTFFDRFYAGYYYGTTEYQWILFALFGDNTEEVAHMFMIGYQWRGFFAELIYQHGEGVDRIETAEEFDYGKANTESFSFMIGYTFSVSIE